MQMLEDINAEVDAAALSAQLHERLQAVMEGTPASVRRK